MTLSPEEKELVISCVVEAPEDGHRILLSMGDHRSYFCGNKVSDQ